MMLCGHAGAEACMTRSTQASFFELSPADNGHFAERLTHCNWSIDGRATSVSFLEDRGHRGTTSPHMGGFEGWHPLEKMQNPTFSSYYLDEMKPDEMQASDED